MKKIFFVLSMLITFVTSCDDDKPDPIAPPPGPPAMAERTVLAYLVADNNLSSLIRDDFREMVEGMVGVDDRTNNFLVYCDPRSDVPRLMYLQKNGVGEVIVDTVKTYEAQNPLDKNVMTSILNQVIDEYPAKDYGLVMASHAEGWVEAQNSANARWFGDHQGTNMNITDLREILEAFPRFNFIFFDACYMQAIEVAYELRNCTDYIVSSPTEIPGPGAPYQKVVPYMFDAKEEAAIHLASGYFDYYKEYEGLYYKDGQLANWQYGVSVSVIKTSELEAFAAITNNILGEHMANRKTVNMSSVLFYDGSNRNYYDFDGLMKLVTGENEQYNEWRLAFDKVQPYFQTTDKNYSQRKGFFDMTDASGISIYVPDGSLIGTTLSFYRSFDWYTDGGWKNAGW
ncbi:clostripain-related cysteine peptidase [Bacteroides sp. 519]|uniref:clostripain-related cysteine peptidase n=1 Tax=Bacteroides sp. 519 TaxID=2302937 RepID=UPI0013D6A892|nr:clostripain-related cysteine peptidase [Bacteroides sp. 519]NDV60649.1 hypothetical protein [Bacteroides sp. 519]